MGECYWHGYEVYPGHPCPECERKRRIREWVGDKNMYERAKKSKRTGQNF